MAVRLIGLERKEALVSSVTLEATPCLLPIHKLDNGRLLKGKAVDFRATTASGVCYGLIYSEAPGLSVN